MIKALLLDLDGTLLDNDIQAFLQVYLQRLAKAMAHVAPPDRFISLLMQGTQAMLDNRDPLRTLAQAFAQAFYPALGVPEIELRPQFEAFYRQQFPGLSGLTRRFDQAPGLVRTALEAGLQVAVATNPLFPRMAIEERIRWAGLSPEGFALITTYEQFHSTKPHLAYYTEALGRLGVAAFEAAMIGNDPLDDLAPARLLGMATFLSGPASAEGYPSGDLAQARAWLATASEATDEAAAKSPEATLARLQGQLSALLGMLDGLDPANWARRPAPDSWAPVEIVCHLRDVEAEVNLPRLRVILAEAEPFISAADTDRWAEARGYRAQSGPPALQAFAQARLEALRLLEGLEPVAWRRPALHALLGPTSLGEILNIVADHDLVHLGQLRQALST